MHYENPVKVKQGFTLPEEVMAVTNE